ncbi:MAG: formylglycine-generating enzyme family protein, partial [Planctomycetes bacterium]|nr:formylglycine-generating enzyme family protein [Planctomycetota bacterium]
EWCYDEFVSDAYTSSGDVDPVAPESGSGSRVNRGGGFSFSAVLARVAYRSNGSADNAGNGMGVRPARAVER